MLETLFSPQRLKPLQPAMGSEDFSFFAAKVPAFYFFLGVRPPGGRVPGPALPGIQPRRGRPALGPHRRRRPAGRPELSRRIKFCGGGG